MRERPDPANGPEYDPHWRTSVWDFVPKHNPNRHCKPYYLGDHYPHLDPDHTPANYFQYHALHNPSAVNTAPYVSKLHPYLYGLPRSRQGRTGGD